VAGDAALLVDPLDTDAIAGALDRLLSDRDLAARLGAAAAARAATYTWARTAEAMVGAYREAAGIAP
jgi:alpha-1,3-rhamnosyl/mannosyltransferase